MSNRVFKNKKNLESLIRLRRKGYTLKSLALIFNVDFTSVYHHVKGIKSENVLILTLSNIFLTFQVDYISIIHLLDIHPKQQKTYAEYLAESRQRDRFPNTLNKLKHL